MNSLKKLLPNKIKQEGKFLLYKLLRIPYNRAGLPIEITHWLPNTEPITYIDIGASRGLFSESVTRHYKIKKGVLIEPINYLVQPLKAKFADTNKFQVLNYAISDTEGEIEFFVSPDADVLSSILKVKEGYFDAHLSAPVKTIVKAKTLDNIASECGLSGIDLLKIDAQGAEHMILTGGLQALKRTSLVYTEFSFKPVYEGSSTFFELFQILNNNNFRLVNVSPGYLMPNQELVQGDALFINNALL